MKTNWSSWRVAHITLGAGFGMRFALGFCIDRYSVNIDIGPFWLYIEW